MTKVEDIIVKNNRMIMKLKVIVVPVYTRIDNMNCYVRINSNMRLVKFVRKKSKKNHEKKKVVLRTCEFLVRSRY